jgi:hypothetical protein
MEPISILLLKIGIVLLQNVAAIGLEMENTSSFSRRATAGYRYGLLPKTQA